MKDKSKIILVVVILLVAAVIVRVCYGIKEGKKNPIVTMQVAYHDADGNEKTGTIKMELYPDVAPESVANFIALANNGFYDGLTFHRIEKDFVVQGGDKEGTGSGSASVSDLDKSVAKGSDKDYTYSIKGEFSANDVNNTLKFGKGVLGMARSDYSSYGLTTEGYNSASSQFFIVTTDDKAALKNLNQYYASFGKIIEGYEFVEEIASVYSKTEESNSEENKTEEDSESKDVPKMNSVRVETFGANYGLPNKINYDEILSTVNKYQSLFNNINSNTSTDVSTDTSAKADATGNAQE